MIPRASASQKAESAYEEPAPAARYGSSRSSWLQGLLATALFRCWHILLFYTAWATVVSVVTKNVYSLAIAPTLLTVIGTVLGFVISVRTTSSFERYNEGRRLWSQIILNSRTFARLVWFHVPESSPVGPAAGDSEDALKARVLIEKKTVINLIEAFAIAVKHYLRGEDGIYYTDLYYLIKYLPAYALPAGIPSAADLAETDPQGRMSSPTSPRVARTSFSQQGARGEGQPGLLRRAFASEPHLPLPATTTTTGRLKPTFLEPTLNKSTHSHRHATPKVSNASIAEKVPSLVDEGMLLPARMPPKWYIFDLFPFSLLVKQLTKKGKEVKGKTAAKLRATLRSNTVSHNLPLEISLYLSSYVAALQNRKIIDPPTAANLLVTLNGLVDALTGLERILTTPIPWSYSIHLWLVTIVYCFLLPLQIWQQLKWLTIPATSLVSFIFFGFLVAGEEIENPFGYDKNDLNLDHFTHNIIRNELRAITGTPAPDPARWAFAAENDLVFAAGPPSGEERVTPTEWLGRGYPSIQQALASGSGI